MSPAMDRDAELFTLDEVTCRTMLRTQPVGRLVIPGDVAHVVPLNFRVVDDVVGFRTASDGVAAAAIGGRVAFEVDMFDERTCSGWSVVVVGRLVELDGARLDVVPWAPGERERALAVTIDELTGRLLRGAVEARPSDGYL
jgi:hypothetical protein